MVSAKKRKSGFTVVELLIVIAVMMILAGVSVPAFFAYLPKHRSSGAARRLFTDLQWMKMRAISENNDYVMTFDTAGNTYSIYDDGDNDYTTAGAETAELIRSVDIPETFNGIEFGYVAGESDPYGVAIPSAVTFSGVPPGIIFRPTGLADQSGAVYVKPVVDDARKDRQRAVTVKATGHIRLYRNTGTSWD